MLYHYPLEAYLAEIKDIIRDFGFFGSLGLGEADDYWSNEWKCRYGASKFVIWSNLDPAVVYKIPFEYGENGEVITGASTFWGDAQRDLFEDVDDWDYVMREGRIYRAACEEGLEEMLAATAEEYFEVEGLRFYLAERCDCDDLLDIPDNFKGYRKAVDRYRDHYAESFRIDDYTLDFIAAHGVDEAYRFSKFMERYDICDLHVNNRANSKHGIVFIDYSNYYHSYCYNHSSYYNIS